MRKADDDNIDTLHVGLITFSINSVVREVASVWFLEHSYSFTTIFVFGL